MGLALSLALFAVAAAAIWWGGFRVERLTGVIAARTGLGHAAAGMIMLAVVTSLPELATTLTAVLADNVDLAVHNLLGGVAFQVVVLAIADGTSRRGPVTRFAPSPGLLVLGVGVVLLLGIAISGMSLAGRTQFAVSLPAGAFGLNPVLLLLPVAYVGIVIATRRAEREPSWQALPTPADADGGTVGDGDEGDEAGNRRLAWTFAGLALIVVIGGWAAATLAERIAAQAGLSSGFVGATLLAAATSLPEISTSVAAVRNQDEELAVSNVMGSNCIDVTLLALVSLLAADAFTRPPGNTVILTAALGVVLTAVYLLGALERSDRAVAGLGLDSLAVVTLYLAGMGALYGLS